MTVSSVEPRRMRRSQPQHPLGRFIRVWDAEGYEDRLATILNIALVGGLFFSLFSATLITWASSVYFPLSPVIVPAFTIASVVLHVGLFWLNKRGQYRLVANLYVWAFYTLVCLAIILTDGASAPFWIFYMWPLLLAAVLLSPATAARAFGGMLALWVLLRVGDLLGVYTPFIDLPAENAMRFVPIFFLSEMAISVGVLIYTIRYLLDTQSGLEETTQALEASQDALEVQVQERTLEARRFEGELRAIQWLNEVIVLASDLPTLLDMAADLIAEHFGIYRAAIFLLDEAGEWLVLEAASGTPEVEPVQLRVGVEGIVGRAGGTGRSYVAPDISKDPYYISRPTLAQSRSAAAVPIIVQGRLLGVVAVESDELHAFDEARVQVLQALPNVLGIAIQNVRRFERLQETVERLSRYERREIARQWRESLFQRGGNLRYLYDRVRVLSLPEEAEMPLAGNGQGSADIDEITTEEGKDGKYLLFVPIKIRDRAVGRFVFESELPWQSEEIEVVASVVTQLGLALENARLLEDTRRRALTEQTAGEITARVRAQAEIESVLERALADLGEALGAERGAARLTLTGGQEQ